MCASSRSTAFAPTASLSVSAASITALHSRSTYLTLSAVSRWYAAAPDPLDANGNGDSEEEQERVVGNPRVHALVDQICEMNILEIADLTELLRKRLGITTPPAGM